MDVYRLLPDDRRWIEERITQLGGEIKDLGPEFKEVLDQSSETWHDNAPFDAVRDKQSLLYAEYSHLKYILLNCENIKVAPGNSIRPGCYVSLLQKDTVRRYYISGDWSRMTGGRDETGASVTTCRSPLAQNLLGKSKGRVTEFGTIQSVSYRES